MWLVALEPYDQALGLKKNPDEKYFFIMEKNDLKKKKDFFEKHQKNRKCSNFKKIYNRVSFENWIFSFFPRFCSHTFRFFSKKSKLFTIIFDFFTFLSNFLMDFKKFGCFEKLKLRSLRKVVCLFTKYAPLGLCVTDFEIL